MVAEPILKRREFLGVDFIVADREQILDLIGSRLGEPFRVVVTPNVDNVVNFAENSFDLRRIYADAWLSVCDSRVLALLARTAGVSLPVYPGADLTADLLRSERHGHARIAVVGPSAEQFLRLQERFPTRDLRLIPAPKMALGSLEFARCVEEAASAEWDYLFVGLGFPKQERFVSELRLRGRLTGVAFCIGASLDFLTGDQRRAPKLLQNLSLEWLYRLASNPVRLWRRYLTDAIRIVPLFVRGAGRGSC